MRGSAAATLLNDSSKLGTQRFDIVDATPTFDA
jgi:hypothetical protein